MAESAAHELAEGRYYDAGTHTRYWHFPQERVEHWEARTDDIQQAADSIGFAAYVPPRRAENGGLLTVTDLENGGYVRREWIVSGPYEPANRTGQAEIMRVDYVGERQKNVDRRISNNPERTFRALERLAKMTIGGELPERLDERVK